MRNIISVIPIVNKSSPINSFKLLISKPIAINLCQYIARTTEIENIWQK